MGNSYTYTIDYCGIRRCPVSGVYYMLEKHFQEQAGMVAAWLYTYCVCGTFHYFIYIYIDDEYD